MALVIDASITIPWFFNDEATTSTDRIYALALGDGAVAPSIWASEVANVLVTAERRGRTSASRTHAYVALLNRLSVHIDSRSSLDPFSILMPLAREHALSIYDAAYLELAIRRGLPLATLDRRLQAAAQSSGIQLLA